MNRSRFSVLLGALGLGWCLFAFPYSAHALSIAPSIIEEHADPGETKSVSITVTNDEKTALKVDVALQKFFPLGTTGQQQFLPASDTVGLPSWTFIGTADRVLQPGEKQVVPIQIRVPPDAAIGGTYEAVFFSAEPSAHVQAAVGIRSRVGALILFTVGSATTTELAVTDWRLIGSASQDSLRGTAQVTLRNSGGVHTAPQGEVIIRNLFGHEVARFPLNPLQSRVLPASERTFDVVFGPTQSSQGFIHEIGNELTAFGIGRYTISLEGVGGMRVLPATLYLTVFPWYIFSVTLIGIVVLGIGFRLYRRRLIRAMQNRSS